MPRPSAPNVGIRFDADLGEFQMRCGECARGRRRAFWPLTLDFWSPEQGMTRCKACWRHRHNQREAERRRSDPAYAERIREINRQNRRAMGRIWEAQRWERLKADPVAYAEYRERRRETGRLASARYRARQRGEA